MKATPFAAMGRCLKVTIPATLTGVFFLKSEVVSTGIEGLLFLLRFN